MTSMTSIRRASTRAMDATNAPDATFTAPPTDARSTRSRASTPSSTPRSVGPDEDFPISLFTFGQPRRRVMTRRSRDSTSPKARLIHSSSPHTASTTSSSRDSTATASSRASHTSRGRPSRRETTRPRAFRSPGRSIARRLGPSTRDPRRSTRRARASRVYARRPSIDRPTVVSRLARHASRGRDDAGIHEREVRSSL